MNRIRLVRTFCKRTSFFSLIKKNIRSSGPWLVSFFQLPAFAKIRGHMFSGIFCGKTLFHQQSRTRERNWWPWVSLLRKHTFEFLMASVPERTWQIRSIVNVSNDAFVFTMSTWYNDHDFTSAFAKYSTAFSVCVSSRGQPFRTTSFKHSL